MVLNDSGFSARSSTFYADRTGYPQIWDGESDQTYFCKYSVIEYRPATNNNIYKYSNCQYVYNSTVPIIEIDNTNFIPIYISDITPITCEQLLRDNNSDTCCAAISAQKATIYITNKSD